MALRDEIWQLAHSSEPEDKREWAVLYWRSQGLTVPQVSDKLGMSQQWVRRYITCAYKRFGCPETDQKRKEQWMEKNVLETIREFIRTVGKALEPVNVPLIPPEVPEVVEGEPVTDMPETTPPLGSQGRSLTRAEGAPLVPGPKGPSCTQIFLGLLLGAGLLSLCGLLIAGGFVAYRALMAPAPPPTTAPTVSTIAPRPSVSPSEAPDTAEPSMTPSVMPSETPTLANLDQLPPPGTVLKAGQVFSKGGLAVTLDDKLQITDGEIYLHFTIFNQRSANYILRFRRGVIHVQDSLGNDFEHVYCCGEGSGSIYSTTIYPNGSYSHPIGWSTHDEFPGIIQPEASYLMLILDEMAGMQDLRWTISLQ